MSDRSLFDFMMNILQSIDYGSLPPTNRAYQWMKNVKVADGPCLNYLKSYVTADNLISQQEMNALVFPSRITYNCIKSVIRIVTLIFEFRYKKLEKEGRLISEEELDKQLEAYVEGEVSNDYELIDTQSCTSVLENAEKYLKELNLEEKFLQYDFWLFVTVILRRDSNERSIFIDVKERILKSRWKRKRIMHLSGKIAWRTSQNDLRKLMIILTVLFWKLKKI